MLSRGRQKKIADWRVTLASTQRTTAGRAAICLPAGPGVALDWGRGWKLKRASPGDEPDRWRTFKTPLKRAAPLK